MRRRARRIYIMSPGLWFARAFAIAVGIAALIGLAVGVVWTVAGLLHFHPLW